MPFRTVVVSRHYVKRGDKAKLTLNDNERVVHIESQDDGPGLYVYVVSDAGRPGRER